MLRIHGTIVEMVADVAEYAERVSRFDRDLARQLRRSSMSVLLNEAEGSGLRGGCRRARYDIALGESRETFSGLEGAVAVRYIPEIRGDTRRRFDRIIGTFVRILYAR